MSTDADRIAQLRARMTHYLLHGVGDASEEAVEGNILAEEARKVIDQLAAELDEVRLYYAGWEGRMDDLARERDAERTAHERTKAELAKASTERGAALAAIRSANAEVVAAQDEAAALSKRVAELEAILGRQ